VPFGPRSAVPCGDTARLSFADAKLLAEGLIAGKLRILGELRAGEVRVGLGLRDPLVELMLLPFGLAMPTPATSPSRWGRRGGDIGRVNATICVRPLPGPSLLRPFAPLGDGIRSRRAWTA